MKKLNKKSSMGAQAKGRNKGSGSRTGGSGKNKSRVKGKRRGGQWCQVFADEGGVTISQVVGLL